MAEAGPIFPRRVTLEILELDDPAYDEFGDEGPTCREVDAVFLHECDGYVYVECDEFPRPFWMVRAESDYDEEDGFFYWEVQCPPWTENTPFIDSLRGRLFVKQALEGVTPPKEA